MYIASPDSEQKFYHGVNIIIDLVSWSILFRYSDYLYGQSAIDLKLVT